MFSREIGVAPLALEVFETDFPRLAPWANL
jgi:hypothetical protein